MGNGFVEEGETDVGGVDAGGGSEQSDGGGGVDGVGNDGFGYGFCGSEESDGRGGVVLVGDNLCR